MSDIVISSPEAIVTSPPISPAVATSDLIEAVKHHLYTGSREPRNRLAEEVDASTPTWTCTYDLKAIQDGARLSCGLEDVYVWSVAAPAAVVERGQFGSTAATHATNAIVTVNPRFSDAEVFRELNNEISSLVGDGLYRMRTLDLTYSPVAEGYDMAGATDVLDIYEARWSSPVFNKWPLLPAPRLSRSMPTAAFPSGFGLFIDGAGILPGRTVRVRYKSGFTALSSLTDDLTATSGVPAAYADILALGAAIRLAAGREIKRNFTESQGDTRRAEEVPAGANLNAPADLRQLRAQRVAQEVANLARAYPVRRYRATAV